MTERHANGSGMFVVFAIGTKRFALPAEGVAELVAPGQLHRFPHTTPRLSGVILRRGHIVPVCDVAEVLVGPGAPLRRFYLLARRRFGTGQEWNAIPVTGECELVEADLMPRSEDRPEFVRGSISVGGEQLEVLEFEKLAPAEARP